MGFIGSKRPHMASFPFPRPLLSIYRRLSTVSSPPSNYWHILRSHSPPPPLETFLSSSIPIPSPSLLLSTLSSLSPSPSPSPSDLLLSLRLLLWSSLHPLLRLSPSSYSSAASLLHLSSRPHLLHLLLDSYHSDRIPLSSKHFTVLLTLSLHASLPFPAALSLLRRMPDFGCSPDVPAFNALLRLPSTTAPAASAILNDMKSNGLLPDMITYVSVIKKLCSGKQLAAARNLLEAMRADGCSPNVVVYSALLDGACSCGDLDAALEIFEQMEAPNVVSYTCLMKCLCETGKLEEALGVLDKMGRNGCKPNRVTVKTLMKGFCEEGRVDDAYKLVERMVSEKGGVSSDECYSLLVVCLLRVGDWEAAEGLLGRMVERGVRPDGVALNSVMRAICERRRFLDGYNWIGVLEEKGVDCVDKDVYSCVLAGLCEVGHLVEAVKLGKGIVENGVRVEDSCVDCMVEVMEKVGEGELASQLMRMKEETKASVTIAW